MILLKNIECYTPSPVGRKDILLAGGRIERIVMPGQLMQAEELCNAIDCTECCAFPGIIDQHAHIIGGGGEQGPASGIPELTLSDLLTGGVTTVVGVLGLDSIGRNLHALLHKARALEAQGITAHIYTGSYSVPVLTLTGSITEDLVLIDRVIGTGEVAISDHRATLCSPEELRKLAAQTHVGGMLGGKAGVLHLHVGDGRRGLEPLMALVESSDLPLDMFAPTHVNRSEQLFLQAMTYLKSGGWIDLTAGEEAGVPVPEALLRLSENKLDLSRVTVSSDGNGSIPGGGVSRVQSLYYDLQSCIHTAGLPPDATFRLVTENVAKLLKLHPAKGALQEGNDADILVTDRQYHLDKLFCRGRLMVDHGVPLGDPNA